ncbi:MAG: bifunctional hydroxymethylpyrimidine kinase/phosphomethylpyrimidine kinase [Gemmatimonadota bacterium]
MDGPVDIPVALTIAGSDSGGGAGIQADLKSFHQFGAFGTSVVTAVTAQNTRGVTAIHPIPLDLVRAQLRALADDLPPAAAKTGMLATSALVEVVADEMAMLDCPLVVDPVMVATSGDRLLDDGAERALLERLIPRATLVTPNLGEAERLTGAPVRTPEEMGVAARRLVELGADAALVKGGHLSGDVVDVLFDGQRETTWARVRIESRHTHGTGCTLSAVVTAGLAHGQSLSDSVDRALAFVAEAIATAPGLGSGHGPLNHFARHDGAS